MNTPSSSSSSIAPSEADTAEIAAVLRPLLPLGKKKIDQKFSNDIDRKVNLLVIKLQKEPNEVLAFQCLGLIGLAITKGNKSAAKQKIRPMRWVDTAPPTLNALSNDDERLGAIKLLSSIKSSWKISYALREAIDTKTNKPIANELIKLAVTASTSHAELVKGLYELVLEYIEINPDGANLILKLVVKLLPATEIETGNFFGEEFSNLASTVADFIQKSQSSPKTALEIQKCILGILEIVSSRDPTVLLNEKTLYGLTSLSNQQGGWPKPLQKPLYYLSSQIISTAIQHVKMYGMNHTSEVRQLLEYASHCLPLEKASAKFITDREIIKTILHPAKNSSIEDSTEPSTRFGIQEQIAALLVSWHRYFSDLPDPSVAEEVNSLVDLVASKARVEMYGAKGDVVQYQPLQHFLGDSSAQPPANVRIEIPGVRVLRSDTSQRVLTRALVFPVK
jgi:hypothetical protein